jgi:hypothetical protein
LLSDALFESLRHRAFRGEIERGSLLRFQREGFSHGSFQSGDFAI